MGKPVHAWACVSPEWATPPRTIDPNTVRRTRQESIDSVGFRWAFAGGWSAAYRKGWRCVRITLTPESRNE